MPRERKVRSRGVPDHRTTFNDKQIERIVLGVMMLTPDLATRGIETLNEEDFDYEVHKKIFRVCKKLYNAGKSVDVVMVARGLKYLGDLLEGQAALDAMGVSKNTQKVPVGYLWDMNEDMAGNVFMLNTHINVLKRYARLRQLRDIMLKYEEEITIPIVNVDELVDDMITELVNIDRAEDERKSISLNWSVGETKKGMQKLRIGKRDGSVAPPFPELKRLGYWHPGDLIVLGGDTGSGKTTLALEILRLSAHVGVHCGIICLEQTAGQLTQKLISAEAKQFMQKDLPHYKLAQSPSFIKLNWKDIEAASNKLESLPMWINDCYGQTIESIQSTMLRLRAIAPNEDWLFVVDYLQLVRTEKNFYSRQQQVAYISRSLKLLSQRINAPILAISQLNKSSEYREKGKSGGKPMLGAMREASDIENDASKVFAIWGSGSAAGTRVLLCLKNRQGIAGPKAEIVFNWEPEFSRYYTDQQKQQQSQLQTQPQQQKTTPQKNNGGQTSIDLSQKQGDAPDPDYTDPKYKDPF